MEDGLKAADERLSDYLALLDEGDVAEAGTNGVTAHFLNLWLSPGGKG